jgi:sugar lactone lactonase YvrE
MKVMLFMKKSSFLAALVLPLFVATAASAGPVILISASNLQSVPSNAGLVTGLYGNSNGLFYQSLNSSSTYLIPTSKLSNPTVSSSVVASNTVTSLTNWENGILQSSNGTLYLNSGYSNQITVVPTSGSTSTLTVGTDIATQEAFSPDGQVLYVATAGPVSATYSQNTSINFLNNSSNAGGVYAINLSTGLSTKIFTGGHGTESIAVDKNGNVFVGDQFGLTGTQWSGISSNIYVIPSTSITASIQSGTPTSVGSGAQIIAVGSSVSGLLIDTSGNLWVSNAGNANQPIAVILKQDLNIAQSSGSTATMQTVLGNSTSIGSSFNNTNQAITIVNGRLYIGTWGAGIFSLDLKQYEPALVAVSTTPDSPSNLAAATVNHTTMKLSWGYSSPSATTKFICTASNGVSVTVTGTSNTCSLNGFDLYIPGSYSFSVIAVVDGVQSDAAVLNVNVKS